MLYADSEKGRCRSCGFLAKHGRDGSGLPTPRFYEIDPLDRKGTRFNDLFAHWPDLATPRAFVTDLVCFIGVADLVAELQCPVENSEACLMSGKAILNRDRQCPGWYPYTQGFSPREHYKELKTQQLEIDRRAFDLRLSEMNRKAQEDSLRVAEASKAIVGDLKDIALANDKFTRRVTALVILLAGLQTIFTVLALPNIPWVQRLWHRLFG